MNFILLIIMKANASTRHGRVIERNGSKSDGISKEKAKPKVDKNTQANGVPMAAIFH
jgi:hypothetical protein